MAHLRQFMMSSDTPIVVNLDQVLFARQSPLAKRGVIGSNLTFADGSNQVVLESLHDILASGADWSGKGL